MSQLALHQLGSIAFIVVTRNGSRYIGDCLASICRTNPRGEIFVVDNGSDDAKKTLQISRVYGAHFISFERNKGVAAAWNAAAQQIESDLLIFLNQDVELFPDSVRLLVDTIYNSDIPAVVGCKLYFPKTRIIQHAGGIIQWPRCNTLHRGYGQEDKGQYDEIASVDYITGAVMGCFNNTYLSVGGFDERFYPAYYEDVDFCMRIRLSGGAAIYQPSATAYHYEGSTLGIWSPQFVRIFTRNRFLFAVKYLNDHSLVSDFIPVEVSWLNKIEDPARSIILESLKDCALEFTELIGNEKGLVVKYVIDTIIGQVIRSNGDFFHKAQ